MGLIIGILSLNATYNNRRTSFSSQVSQGNLSSPAGLADLLTGAVHLVSLLSQKPRQGLAK